MRLVITGLALAFAVPVLAGDATAQSVTTEALAANEVLLEVNASGSVTTRADLVTLQVQASAYAATEEEARSEVDAQIRRIVQAARGTGVAAADIETGEIMTAPSMDVMMSTLDTNAVDMEEMESSDNMATGASASSMIELRLRNVGRLDSVTRALDETGASAVPLPVYALVDSAGARREARARALAAARADAEAYAAALGLRVARIVRVTERAGMDFFSMMMNESAMRRSMNGAAQNEPEIETTMMLGVDFALAPR